MRRDRVGDGLSPPAGAGLASAIAMPPIQMRHPMLNPLRGIESLVNALEELCMAVLVVMPGCPGNEVGHLHEPGGLRIHVERNLSEAMKAASTRSAHLPSRNQTLHQTLVTRFVSYNKCPMRLPRVMKPRQELIKAHEDLFQRPLHGIRAGSGWLMDGHRKVAGFTTARRRPCSQVSKDCSNHGPPISQRDASPLTTTSPDSGRVELEVGVAGANLAPLKRIQASRKGITVLLMQGNPAQDQMSVGWILGATGFVEVQQVDEGPLEEWQARRDAYAEPPSCQAHSTSTQSRMARCRVLALTVRPREVFLRGNPGHRTYVPINLGVWREATAKTAAGARRGHRSSRSWAHDA